jgi:hypothetical protein
MGDGGGVLDEERVAEGVEVSGVGVEGGLLARWGGEGREGEEVHGKPRSGMGDSLSTEQGRIPNLPRIPPMVSCLTTTCYGVEGLELGEMNTSEFQAATDTMLLRS